MSASPGFALSTAAAAFNLAALTLATLGVLNIRRGRREVHRRFMLSALAASALFLVAYLSRMGLVGHIRYAGTGPMRNLYLLVLGTHTPLAVVVVPLVLRVLWLARHEQFERHRRLARITYPLWAYVSATGVLVWVFLFVLPA